MAKCTAPINGHRTASGMANCPACSGGYRDYRFYPTYSSPYVSPTRSSSSGGNGQNRVRARWAPSGSNVLYTPAEIRSLTPVRNNIEKRSGEPDLRDVFCATHGMIEKE